MLKIHLRKPPRFSVRFRRELSAGADRYDEGYEDGKKIGYADGENAANAIRDAQDTSRLDDINVALTKNWADTAETLDDVDERIPKVREVGYSDGYNVGEVAGHEAGYTEGHKSASDTYEARISAELAEVNAVIDGHGDTKAETLEEVSEVVSATIGAACMKAQTLGYTQGVNITNAERNGLDRQRLGKINTALTANGGTAAETLDGVGEKIPEVHAAGVQSEYDRFWDVYQQNGKRGFWGNAFAGSGWNENTFYPKYDIVSNNYSCSAMFAYFGYQYATPFNLEARLLELGITMDVCKANATTHMFQYANISVVPELDFSNLGTLSYLCTYSNITTFRKIKVSETTQYQSNFNGCTELRDITFEGAIGQSGLDFQWCTKLSRASIENIIGALSATASGKSITLSKTAVNAAFTTDEWNALAGTKTNWTISLV